MRDPLVETQAPSRQLAKIRKPDERAANMIQAWRVDAPYCDVIVEAIPKGTGIGDKWWVSYDSVAERLTFLEKAPT